MNEDLPIGVLLGAIVQELAAPLGKTYLAAERARQRLERMQGNLAQLSRSMDALSWLSKMLASPEAAQQARTAAAVAQSLATVARPTDVITTDFSPGLAVLAGPGVLDVVIDNVLTYARKHHSKRSTIKVMGRIVPARLPQWPAGITLTMPGTLVWLTVAIDGPASSPNAVVFDPAAHIGLWLSRQLVRLHGGDLWHERSSRAASFSSIWPLGALIAADGWPDGRVEFGHAVRAARAKLKLSRLKLCQLSGLADTTIRNIETAQHSYSYNSRERLLAGFAKLKKP